MNDMYKQIKPSEALGKTIKDIQCQDGFNGMMLIFFTDNTYLYFEFTMDSWDGCVVCDDNQEFDPIDWGYQSVLSGLITSSDYDKLKAIRKALSKEWTTEKDESYRQKRRAVMHYHE